MLKIKKNLYEALAEDTQVKIYRNGKEFFAVPASCKVNDVYSDMHFAEGDDSKAVYTSANEKMVFEFLDDCVTARYTKKFDAETPIFMTKIFAAKDRGMELVGFDRAFSPQPRTNGSVNLDYYHHLPDISQNGLCSPPLLSFSLGSPDGWVSLGMLDLPDSYINKMDDDFSFITESCGGNKVIPAGSEYKMPGILITFPNDEWDAITVFRNKLIEFGLYTPKKPKFSELPSWWKNPLVCTYGDQLLEDRVGQKFDDKWVENIVDLAENVWGIKNMNLIIDDAWQPPHAFEPIADVKRFPDFRGFIDKLHDRGHHVILWQTPLFDKITNGFVTRAQKMGILSDTEIKNKYFEKFPGSFLIDYTHDDARAFIKEAVRILFGSGEGEYNADGMKLDFLALVRNPEHAKYAHPERGMGCRELLLFYEMFYEEAKKIKPDVLIDLTVGDPRFEHIVDINRMHDTHCGTIEKEIRARISTLALPDLPIDSDGALMFNSWLRTHYISAALYSIPSNYYTTYYHDFVRKDCGHYIVGSDPERIELTENEKKKFGELFQMVKHRPDGHAFLESFGNWVLKDGDTVNGITQRGETVVYYPTDKNDTGYIFTFQDEAIIIPLHGRKIADLTPAPLLDHLRVDYARDQAIMKLTPGVLHTFKNRDSGTSIDRVFKREAENKSSDMFVNYEN